MQNPPTVIIVGAGGRGSAYAKYIENHPDEAKIIGVCEPREFYRETLANKHNIPQEHRWNSWEDLAKLPKMADAVFICTPDILHEAPAIAFANLKYNILLEKPMAPTEEGCRRITKAVKENNIIFAVCHVLRYTPHTRCVIDLLRKGTIGELVSIEALEPVHHWHQAHSFVRGNWRNEALSSFMLLQKSCHDMDLFRYFMNKHCVKVQSFGALTFFNEAHQPKGASDRCITCPPEIEAKCPYSAFDMYYRKYFLKGATNWPLNVITTEITEENVLKALREGPYGRCVFKCDNDVVDHQVVNLLFENNATVSFTMTAFCNENGGRQTRFFGTKGAIRTNGQKLWVSDFLTRQETEIDSATYSDGTINSGHGGGDDGIMEAYLKALRTGDTSFILSGVDETLESHLIVFAAEKSRHTNTVCDIETK